MLSGDSNDNGQNNQWVLLAKNNFARAAHFFVYFFAVVLHKKTISEVIYTCADNLIADKPKNVGCDCIA